jgi:hypothetical protein
VTTGKPDPDGLRRVWATTRGRARALVAASVFVTVCAYDVAAPHLWREGVWWDVVWVSLVLIPATFSLVLLALPWRTAPWVLRAGLAFAVLAAIFTAAGLNLPANFARLGATTLLAWWFLAFFEALSWVVLVACIIPWVDAYSVWRGPTKTITTRHPHVFTNVLSYAFPVPGRHAAANIGLPDLLFFALFLGAAARFGLRVLPTWCCLVAGLGATIALTVVWNLNGLPALPGIALGFLLPNADLLWRRLRGEPGFGDGAEVSLGGAPDDV